MEDKALLDGGPRNCSTNWDTQMLLITLGEQGMMLFERDQPPHHIPTKARQVFDVSGAGDTAIALFTLALCCGAIAGRGGRNCQPRQRRGGRPNSAPPPSLRRS